MKNTRIPNYLLLGTTLIVVLVTPAFAGPFDPAYKAGQDSVHVAFDFDTFDSPWLVSEFYYSFTTYSISGQGPSSSESESDVTFIIPNLIDELPVAHMRLQFFFNSAIDFNLLDVTVVGHDPLGAVANEIGRGGDHSLHVYYIDFDIQPNPDWQEIFFNGDPAGAIASGNFHRLEFDSTSAPEPTSLALLCLGGLSIIHRRRN